MAASPRNTFLNNLATWAYDVPYATQWAIQIDTVASVQGFIGQLQRYTNVDVNGFQIDANILNKLMNSSVMGEGNGLGIHFAQGISTPQENFSPGRVGIEDSGGYLKGITGGDRSSASEKTVSTDLLETNLDFIDGIIRPWVIAASYRGLISRSDETSIKCNLLLTQYTKGSNRPVRKIHEFSGCVPYDVMGSTLDYESEKITRRTVKWLFNHYTYKLVDNV